MVKIDPESWFFPLFKKVLWYNFVRETYSLVAGYNGKLWDASVDVSPCLKALESYISDTLCSSQQLFCNLYDCGALPASNWQWFGFTQTQSYL